MQTDSITLFSDSLLSKWGFADGDIFDWLYDYSENYDPHATLIECVRRKLLPVLSQKVDIQEVMCNHNPCRATTVDGADVTQMWYSDLKLSPPLSPEFVVVTKDEVLEIAKEILYKPQ